MNLGKQGEKFAKDYFLSRGFEIVTENYKFEGAETDLIIKSTEKKQLIFVEVKTRRNKAFGAPEEAINERKQAQMIKSAEGFLMLNPEFSDYEKRFDVAAIMIEHGRMKLNHIVNAF
ncbi:MAG: YraN family protein [Ignavibacteria bacterium]|nr:YraN family protein [Ignavibacteria bacterium]